MVYKFWFRKKFQKLEKMYTKFNVGENFPSRKQGTRFGVRENFPSWKKQNTKFDVGEFFLPEKT